jgi:hypothetical protein
MLLSFVSLYHKNLTGNIRAKKMLNLNYWNKSSILIFSSFLISPKVTNLI